MQLINKCIHLVSLTNLIYVRKKLISALLHYENQLIGRRMKIHQVSKPKTLFRVLETDDENLQLVFLFTSPKRLIIESKSSQRSKLLFKSFKMRYSIFL